MSSKPLKTETPELRKARALRAVADCPESVRKGVEAMPFNEAVNTRDKEIATRLQPRAQRALAKAHGQRVA